MDEEEITKKLKNILKLKQDQNIKSTCYEMHLAVKRTI